VNVGAAVLAERARARVLAQSAATGIATNKEHRFSPCRPGALPETSLRLIVHVRPLCCTMNQGAAGARRERFRPAGVRGDGRGVRVGDCASRAEHPVL
jgi:hypothetical protein